MKVDDLKRELIQQHLEYRDQVVFADLFYTGYHFELGYFNHCIDVIDPFLFILITLMHSGHSQKARTTVRLGFTSLTQLNFVRLGLAKVPTFALICPALTKVVQVSHR